ncbi:UNVERIFIED_CONTAM: hypothetical protein K2H54_050225, partial [Gekko kuhli]
GKSRGISSNQALFQLGLMSRERSACKSKLGETGRPACLLQAKLEETEPRRQLPLKIQFPLLQGRFSDVVKVWWKRVCVISKHCFCPIVLVPTHDRPKLGTGCL